MRTVAIACAVAMIHAVAWGQGADPMPEEEEPPAAPSLGAAPDPDASDDTVLPSPPSSPSIDDSPGGVVGGIPGVVGGIPGGLDDPSDPGLGAGSGTGSGLGSGSGPGPGLGSGSGVGSGSGAGTGSGSPALIVIPPDVRPPDVSAAASPSIIRLGERFTLLVTATYEDGVEVNLREPVELGGAFEVARKTSENRKSPDGRHVREWQLEVYAWELGDLHVPQLAVTFTSHGKAGQVATNAVPVKVTGVLGDVIDDPRLVRGDAPPVSLMSRDWFWAWVAGGVAALVTLVGTVVWIRKRRRRRVRTLIGTLVASTPEPRRLDMTSERALERLLAIENSGVLDRDEDRKRGYAEMVAVIREYTGARYSVATLDLTTAELLRSLAKVAPDAERDQIAAWLERCDIVKYGGFRATAADARSVLDGARALVVATTRAPGREAA